MAWGGRVGSLLVLALLKVQLPTSDSRVGRMCAEEKSTCLCSGSVQYGANGSYFYRRSSGKIPCISDVFGGDPSPAQAKACMCIDGPVPPGSDEIPCQVDSSIEAENVLSTRSHDRKTGESESDCTPCADSYSEMPACSSYRCASTQRCCKLRLKSQPAQQKQLQYALCRETVSERIQEQEQPQLPPIMHAPLGTEVAENRSASAPRTVGSCGCEEDFIVGNSACPFSSANESDQSDTQFLLRAYKHIARKVDEEFQNGTRAELGSCSQDEVLRTAYGEARRVMPGITCYAVDTIVLGAYVGVAVGGVAGLAFAFVKRKSPLLVGTGIVALPFGLAGVGAVAGLSAFWFNLRHREAAAASLGMAVCT